MNGNGVDGRTGRYLPASWGEEITTGQAEPLIDPALERHYQWHQERLEDKFDPERLWEYGVEPQRLDSAGWAVIFGSRVNAKVREALDPLLRRRKLQAGTRFQELLYQGQDKFEFLKSVGVAPGAANPRLLPYYLLIVGDPEDVPFRFQTYMDLDYGVGRICFETPEQYGHYVRSVLDAESGTARPKDVAFFGVANDEPTQILQKGLLDPLVTALKTERLGWPVHNVTGTDATLERLRRLAGGEESPSLLVTGSHGLAFPPGHPQQTQEQGALFCGVAGGASTPAAEVGKETCFSGADVAGLPNLHGMIICLFACYSGGTPEIDSYRENSLSLPRKLAPRPFVSALAQRLLSQPGGGALAVVGHLDRMWSTSFQWSDSRQITAYKSLLNQLLDGGFAGSATEYLGQLHASFGANFADLSEKRNNLAPDFDQETFYRSWRGLSDARNFILLGDPAVRLNYGGWRR